MSGTLRCLMMAGILLTSVPTFGLDFEREIARQEVVTVRVVDTLHKNRGRVQDARHVNRKSQQKNAFQVTLIPKKRTVTQQF